MAVESEFPKVDGDILYASEANLLRPVMQIYNGTGFDSSQSGGAGSDEQSFELTAITSTQAKSAKYVKITFLGIPVGSAAVNASSDVSLKAQIKETGQSYADILSYIEIFRTVRSSSGLGVYPMSDNSISILFELTAGMKTNGFQIKAFSKSDTTVTSSASFTNIQTVVELA